MRIAILRRIVAKAAIVVVALLTLTDAASLVLQKRTVAAADRLNRLTLLASEMRESSNALTRLARSYVVTGDPRYKDRYFEVLDVRAGRRPRPDRYDVSDWNLDRAPLAGGRPRSLLSILRQEHVGAEAFAMLATSLAESEALARVEIDVMARTTDLLERDGTELSERDPLVLLLHDQEYQRQKVRIMDAVKRFEVAVRTDAARHLRQLQNLQRLVLVLGGGIVGAMIVGFVWFGRYTNRAILSPLVHLGEAAERVSRADYSARAHVGIPNELGSLANAFNRMAEAIQSDIAEHDRMRREMESLARTDSLTGLSNRRAFLESAESELSRVRRYGREGAVLMLDVDHFKSINDRYGHAIGDAVLERLATLMRAEVREIDLIGRLGGEEFAIFLPELHREDASHVAERLRARVESIDSIVTDAGAVRFTISIGVAMADAPELGLDELLRRADIALYQAKRTGRNRVTIWEPAAGDPAGSKGT